MSFFPTNLHGQSLSDFIDLGKLPKDFLMFDSAEFAYINSAMFQGPFAQDVDTCEVAVMTAVQIHQSINSMREIWSSMDHGNDFLLGIRSRMAITCVVVVVSANWSIADVHGSRQKNWNYYIEERRKEVAQMLAQGHTETEIAKLLHEH